MEDRVVVRRILLRHFEHIVSVPPCPPGVGTLAKVPLKLLLISVQGLPS